MHRIQHPYDVNDTSTLVHQLYDAIYEMEINIFLLVIEKDFENSMLFQIVPRFELEISIRNED